MISRHERYDSSFKRAAICCVLAIALPAGGTCMRRESDAEITAQKRSPLPSPAVGEPVGRPESTVAVNSCNIEVINAVPAPTEPFALKHGGALTMTGWIVDETVRRFPEHVFVVVQSVESGQRWSVPIDRRLPRDDVVKAKQSDRYSGFRARFESSPLPPGDYLLLLLSWTTGPAQLCDAGRRIVIR